MRPPKKYYEVVVYCNLNFRFQSSAQARAGVTVRSRTGNSIWRIRQGKRHVHESRNLPFTLSGVAAAGRRGVFKLSFPSRSVSLALLRARTARAVVLADSEAANGRMRLALQDTQVASGRSAAVESRTSESRVAGRCACVFQVYSFCARALLLSDQV